MKVRILKTVLVEVEKTKLQEIWNKQLRRWETLNVEAINCSGEHSNLTTYDGDTYLHVPTDSFEVV